MKLETVMSQAFEMLWKGTPTSKALQRRAKFLIKSNIEDPELQQKLTPEFTPGCRRWTPGEQYIAAIQQPNVHLVQDHVAALTKHGVRTDAGDDYMCDVVVCATGFSPYSPRFSVVGRDGIALSDCWGRGGPCESYMAAMVAHFPNFFGMFICSGHI
jgi:cation diffusion facilitator CzcD-associated flavoprotein CzcO